MPTLGSPGPLTAYDNMVLAETGLIHYYPLNETAGTTAYDAIGGVNGTCTGVTFAQSGHVTDGSTCAAFSGSSSGITFGSPFALGTGGVFTVEFWFKYSALTNFQAFYQNGIDTHGNSAWLNGTDLALSIDNNSNYSTGITASTSAWHLCHCIYTGTRRQMYIDGVMVLDGALSTPSAPTTSNYFGRFANTGDGPSFAGSAQKVAYYNVALSPSSIAAHYAMTPPPPVVPVVSEMDIRFYGADGLRKLLPSDWIESLDFEIIEQGGYGQGSLKVQEVYAGGFQTFEVERIDVRLWGQLLYRGFVRISQSETTGEDQTDSPTLYGLMEILSGYLVRRRFAYARPVDPGVLFVDMVYEYVKRSGRLANIIVDVSGVSGLSLLIQQFDATGKTFTQAMNDLCDLFPQKLIWGIDVDGATQDRIYLRPRSATTKYKFAIGNNVKALMYPRDATQIVNTLLITGAPLDGSGYPPNLCPNGSFEDTLIPGEYTSNLLTNGDFEHGSGGTRPDNTWQCVGDPSLDAAFGRSGTAAILDNNPSHEAIYEDVAVVDGLPVHATCWAMVIAGESWSFRLVLTYYDSGGSVLDTVTGPWETPTADNVYRHYQLDWTPTSATGAVKLRYYLELDPANSGAHGLNIDDCSVWIDQVAAASWAQGTNSGAHFTTLDWANSDNSLEPYDGGTMVKAQASITGGAGSYAEIATTQAARISVHENRVYYVSAWIWVPASSTVEVKIGGKVWSGGTLSATLVGSLQSLTTPGWNLISYIITTGGGNDGLDVIIRLFNGTACYIDAVSVFENNLPDINHQEIYYPGSQFTAVRSVDDYSGFINLDAAASITNWGPREATVSNDNILTIADLDAFCILYFNAHAISLVNAGLTIFGPTSPVFLDGLVQIVNLQSAPPPLFASNVRYRIDQGGIEMTIDLNNRQPDLALLLREIQEGKR